MMADSRVSSVSDRSSKQIPVGKPRWAFLKGLLTGAAIEVPILALTVWLLQAAGVGDPDAGLMKIVRLTAVFAGVAALLTAGGIGRLAAYAWVQGGRRRAMFVAARAHAIASAGLVVIATIPHGHLPGQLSWAWVALPAAGIPGGILCGAMIGMVCSSSTPLGLSDVWSLAQRPGDALKTLLDPRDLVKLGAALRNRTSTLFDGIFEPAPAAPADPKPDAPDADAPPPVKPTEPSKPA